MTEPVGMTDEEMRVKSLDYSMQVNLQYGITDATGNTRIKPSIWTVLQEADYYFRYLKNGAFTPPDGS